MPDAKSSFLWVWGREENGEVMEYHAFSILGRDYHSGVLNVIFSYSILLGVTFS